MKLAALIGIGITEFWEMTPFELNIYAKAHAEKIEAEYDAKNKSDILQAYMISRWVWKKRVDINKYLNTTDVKREMTDEEMLRRVKALNAAMGGNIEHNA